MDLLDVQPYETGLHRLLRAGVCSDDQLHDYYLSQALRGVAYAVNRTSLPFPNLLLTPSPVVNTSTITTITTKTTTTTTNSINNNNNNTSSSSSLVSSTSIAVPGGVAVLCRMCISSLASHTSWRTVVYLSTRLLCDAATAFGEGNERPSCTQAWMEALCAVRDKMFLREQMRIHRRLALGYILILAGTVSAVGQGHVVGKRLTSHFPEFTQYVLDDVLPFIAIIADTNEGMEMVTSSITEEMESNNNNNSNNDTQQPLTRQYIFKSPSRLTAESNNTIIDIFHNIALDVLDVHQGESNQTENRFVVLDRDVPMRMWSSISILRSALRRALNWIQEESIWHIPSIVSSSSSTSNNTSNTTTIINREIQGVNESFEIVKNSLDSIFAQLLKQQETLECSLKTVEQQFGQNAKDYNEIRNMMWVNTLRLCFLCRTVTSAWIHIHGNNDNTEIHKSDKNVLAFIASFMSSVPVLEEKEKESDVFFASSALLAASFACLVASPISMMQGIIWSSDVNITQEIHKIIIHRALRYKDENVQKLGALLSRLILYSSSSSSAVRSIAESSDQLLELLSDGRDAASQCVTGMLMRAAVERPHIILPALFRRLQHGDTATRRNVLDVLSALPQLCENDSPYAGESFTAEEMRPVLRLMSEELLLRIQDDELLVRLQSSKLFAKVWPEDICRPLLHLATQRDKTVKKQSAAQQALISVVEAHKNDASIILLLIQQSLSLLGETKPSISATPSTPADILAFSKLHSCGVNNNDNETPIDPNAPKLETTDNSRDRLLRLIILLVRRWAEIVPKWTESYTNPIIEHLMEANSPIEQEVFIRVIGQIASICGTREDGAFALLSSCLRIMKPEKNMEEKEEEKGVLQLGLWLDNLIINNNNTQTSTTSSQDTSKIIYQAVAPLLCLRSCPRSVFISPRLEDLSSVMSLLWDILWKILLSTEYREKLPPDVQRLLLELVCKYSASKIFEKIKYLEEKYTNDTNLKVENISCNNAHFIRRVGFFCIGTLLSQNKYALIKEEVNNNKVTVSDKEESEKELLDLLNAAIMALRWTEDIVLPWLLSDESGETNNVSLNSDTQRLSRAAVECMGFITIVSLRRKVFYDAVVAPIMIPFYQLATLYREQIKELKEGQEEEVLNSPSSNNSTTLLGRFEFAIHVQQCALGIIRTHPLSKELLSQWFTVYMPPLIELANASCTIAVRLSQRDIGQIAMECCHVLFLAVMSSSGVSHADPTNGPPGQTSTSTTTSTPKTITSSTPKTTSTTSTAGVVGAAVMSMDPVDREALVAFAVGTARYATLPRLQAAGVKLLAALLAAAPTAFTAAAAAGAVAVLQSVAHIHEDHTTRGLAEHVLSIMAQAEVS